MHRRPLLREHRLRDRRGPGRFRPEPGLTRARLAALLAAALTACSTAGGTQAPHPSPSPSASASPAPSPAPTATPTPVPQQAEASLPDARQEVASTATESLIYVIGGFDSQRRDSNLVFRYEGSWKRDFDFPIAVDHAAAATLGGFVYVAGGNSGGVAQSRAYRLGGDNWLALPPLHHARAALALVASQGQLFAIGGIGPVGEVPQVEAYDPVAETWTDVATLPAPRDHLAGFNWMGLACVAGGRSPNTARVDCLDPASGTWSRLPDLPVPTSGAGAANLHGRAIVAGGEDAGESRIIDHVFRLDPGGSAWTDEPMLTPRHGIQLAVFGDRAWACGGATAPGYAASAVCTSIGD